MALASLHEYAAQATEIGDAAARTELPEIGQDPTLAAHSKALMALGASNARAGHLGVDAVLVDLAACTPEARVAAYFVLVGYWHTAARVDPDAYDRLIDVLHCDASLWDDDQQAGVAALAALTALTVHDDRGVEPAVAAAERRAVLRRVKHTSPYLAGVARRAGV
jgi:hypothetical protein